MCLHGQTNTIHQDPKDIWLFYLVSICMHTWGSKTLAGPNFRPDGWSCLGCRLWETETEDIHKRKYNFEPRLSSWEDGLHCARKIGEHWRRWSWSSLVWRRCLWWRTSDMVSWTFFSCKHRYSYTCYNGNMLLTTLT